MSLPTDESCLINSVGGGEKKDNFLEFFFVLSYMEKKIFVFLS